MEILDIQSVKTHETRKDGRYPLRIGSTVEFENTPTIGIPMRLYYAYDNDGNQKEGVLTTSNVVCIEESEIEIIVNTVNSIYYLKK